MEYFYTTVSKAIIKDRLLLLAAAQVVQPSNLIQHALTIRVSLITMQI